MPVVGCHASRRSGRLLVHRMQLNVLLGSTMSRAREPADSRLARTNESRASRIQWTLSAPRIDGSTDEGAERAPPGR